MNNNHKRIEDDKMTDSFVQWLTAALGGKVSKEAIIFLISMVPILELRGGLFSSLPGSLKHSHPAGHPYLHYRKYPSDPFYSAFN